MKISEVNEKNIEAVIRSNPYGWAGKIAEQHPNLILKILKFCRLGELTDVLKVVPSEMVLQVVEERPDSSYFFVTKFSNQTVEILKTLTEKTDDEIRLRVHFNFIIQEVSAEVALKIVKAFPERIGWIWDIRPSIRNEVEKIFKLED